MSQIIRAPSDVHSARVTGYKCDNCTKTHLILQLKFLAPEGYPDDEAVIMVMQIDEAIATGLIRMMSEEIENPAPAYKGSADIPMMD